MERYSTLYGAHTFVNANGKEVNQYVEVGRSAGLDEFLKGKKIPNPSMAVTDVNNTLTGFVRLPGYDAQPADLYPMLVRYAPMHLKRLDTYDNNVISFNAIACSAPDHQVGNRDGKYRNTHFIDRALLMKAGEYNYLDQIFGTHLVNWKENRDVRVNPINYDELPQKVQLPQSIADAALVQIVAAALINKASVVLKLEKDCIFQLRSMALLKQIYGLFAPIQAAEIGFASYEDPSRIPELIAKTSIRLFVVPAEAELGALESQPNMLVLDLNKELVKPKANDLLRAVSIWYEIPWAERVNVMSVLFAELYDPNDAQTYVDLTRKYKDASKAMEKKLADSRGKIESLNGLKKLYDSFGSLMSIPPQREKFCRIALRLMKLPQETEKAKINREQRIQWIKSELTKLGTEAIMEKGKSGEPTEKEELYRFCCDVLKVDPSLEMSNEVKLRSAMVTKDYVTKEKEAEFAGERAAIAAERANFEADKKAAVDAEKANTEAVRKQADEQLTKLQEENKIAVAAEAAKTAEVQKKLDDADRVREEAIAELNKNHEAAMTEKDNAHTAAMTKKDSDHAAALAEEHQKGVAAVAAQKAETKRVEGLLEKANGDLQRANNAYNEQSEELSKVKAAATRRKQKNTEYESEIERLNKLLNSRGIDTRKPEPTITILGVKVPQSAMKVIAIAAAAAFLIGAIAGAVIGVLVGGNDKPDPTTPSATVETTTAPTTVPTTVPETTAPPTEPDEIFEDDGSINWDYVHMTYTDVLKLEHEAADIDALLAELSLTAEGYPRELEAVLTISSTDADQPVFLTVSQSQEAQTTDPAVEGETADDADVSTDEETTDDSAVSTDEETTDDSAVSTDEETTDDAGVSTDEETTDDSAVSTDEEPTPELTALSELVPSLVLDNGSYRIEVFYSLDDDARQDRNAATNVAQQLFREITAEDAAVTITTVVGPEVKVSGDKITVVGDEIAVDLNTLMGEVTGDDLWWKNGFKLELRQEKLIEMKNVIGSSRIPIVVILLDDDSEAVVYNYADSPNKREKMVGVLGDNGYSGVYNETQVIGFKPAEQETPAPSTEAPAESTEAPGQSGEADGNA